MSISEVNYALLISIFVICVCFYVKVTFFVLCNVAAEVKLKF